MSVSCSGRCVTATWPDRSLGTACGRRHSGHGPTLYSCGVPDGVHPEHSGLPASLGSAGSSKGAFFPLGFFTAFLDFLAANRDRLEPITYADFDWGDDYNGEASYPQEGARWLGPSKDLKTGWLGLSKDLKAAGRAQVLIQHDIDTWPHRTNAVVEAEREREIRSSVMIFRRRVDRRRLVREGELALTEYPIDDDLLQAAEDEGFVIGYHFNAMEHALWNQRRAREIFAEDLSALRQRYAIDFVSAHGGVVGPDGSNNRDLVPPDLRALGVRWVHNGQSPRFTANYSDGALNSTKLDPAGRDLRDFMRRLRPGGRYRVLLHPQYYSDPWRSAPGLQGTSWYDELLAAHADDPEIDSWSGVELSW